MKFSIGPRGAIVVALLIVSACHGPDAPDGPDGGDGCSAICARADACGVGADCSTSCAAATAPQRMCLAACDAAACSDWLSCVSACGQANSGSDPYGTCAPTAGGGVACPAGALVCEVNVSDATGAIHKVCTPTCTASACPVPTTGTAVPQCDVTSTPSTCTLDCSGGKTCPDGMTCVVETDTCMWPAS